ncbi:MAG: hypothetical protein IPM20_06370 [Gammaproteobacteria bacterium]|nr:hypothetical protein [Gammaproteobacteria bacterium]
MTEWIPVGAAFIQADVIRCKESIWDQRRTRKGRAFRLGERLVIAEVLSEEDEKGWVWLLVVGCEVLSEKPSRRPRKLVLDKGSKIKRKRTTLARGNIERLPWSEESARLLLASRFLRNSTY